MQEHPPVHVVRFAQPRRSGGAKSNHHPVKTSTQAHTHMMVKPTTSMKTMHMRTLGSSGSGRFSRLRSTMPYLMSTTMQSSGIFAEFDFMPTTNGCGYDWRGSTYGGPGHGANDKEQQNGYCTRTWRMNRMVRHAAGLAVIIRYFPTESHTTYSHMPRKKHTPNATRASMDRPSAASYVIVSSPNIWV